MVTIQHACSPVKHHENGFANLTEYIEGSEGAAPYEMGRVVVGVYGRVFRASLMSAQHSSERQQGLG